MEMRKLIEATLVSLDGVVGSPQEWALPHWDEESKATTWNATVIKGDVAAEVARLKSEPGKAIMKYGTSRLDRTLISHGLVDEFHFSVFPVVVGRGPRLFDGIDTSGMTPTLTGTKTFGNGIIELTYVPEYTAAGHPAATEPSA
jgi:dihydrofolate reductase